MIVNLISSLDSIHAVSPEAAKLYEKSLDKLVDHVNHELESNSKIIELLGGSPFGLMRNNHSNHATFMTTVFKIGSYEL
ncbi:MAG: hypothetical protein WCJ37_14600, partial [Syntrophus sp. (in: bacteria)]